MIRQARMPGFTAEVALAPTARYHASGPRAEEGAGDAIAAQGLPGLLGRRGLPEPCDPNCVCVSPEGCPCCQSMLPRFLPSRRKGRFL